MSQFSSFQEKQVKAYDSGLSLPFISENSLFSSPNLSLYPSKKEVRSLTPKDLYVALKTRGLSDCLDILPLMSKDQWVRICDYDIWTSDELSIKKLFVWLQAFAEVSPEELYKRFSSLDEEYQLASMGGLLRVYEKDQWEALDEERQDSMRALPGEELFYEILTDDPSLQEAAEGLIEACLSQDMDYTLRLLAHSAYVLLPETQHLLSQFRRARLEEDGFISWEEARELFYPVPLPIIRAQEPGLLPMEPTEGCFLQKVLEAIGQEKARDWFPSFLVLANALGSGAHLDPSDLTGLKMVMNHGYGLLSLGLEYLSQGDIPKASEELLASHPKTLFQTGLSLIYDLQKDVICDLQKKAPKEAALLEKYTKALRFGAIQDLLDQMLPTLGLEDMSRLKGLFNRFPSGWKTEGERIYFTPIQNLGDLARLRGDLL
jgi:hypothetical protein